jgi:hypothetical protein
VRIRNGVSAGAADEQSLEGIRGQYAIHISIAPYPFTESELHGRKGVLAYLKRYKVSMAATTSTESPESSGARGEALKAERPGGKEKCVIGSAVDQKVLRFTRRRQFQIEHQPVRCGVAILRAGERKREMIAGHRLRQLGSVIQCERFRVIVNKDVEVFQKVFAQNALEGLTEPAELTGVDPIDFKIMDSQACDSYA